LSSKLPEKNNKENISHPSQIFSNLKHTYSHCPVFNMKICFDFVCDEALIYSRAALALQRKGHDVCAITLGNRWKEGWTDQIDLFPLDLEDSPIDWDKELDRIKQEYSSAVAGFIQADRFIAYLGRDEQVKLLVWTFLKIEELVAAGVTKFFITGVAYLYNLVMVEVARKNNLVCYSLYGTRQKESRFTLSEGYGGKWDLVDKIYAENLENKEKIDYSAEANEVIDFRIKFSSPDYMASARQTGGISSVFVREFFHRLKNWYFKNWSKKEDYITQHPLWYAKRNLKRIINGKYLKFVFKFDSVNYDDKYYIYPLHLQPEASTLVLGPDYVNQLETIKAISRRLPLGEYLYVKEHPAAYGMHSHKMYQEIQQLFNVKLIAPGEDTKRVINNSQGVIVISGTMGWEAFLAGKPALVLGDVFYDQFPGVYKISNIEQIRSLFNSNLKVAEVDDIAIALNAIYKGSFKGMFDVHKLDTAQIVLSEENLSALEEGILKIVEYSK